jgi:hypothetical protein
MARGIEIAQGIMSVGDSSNRCTFYFVLELKEWEFFYEKKRNDADGFCVCHAFRLWDEL